ncbi:MAG: hypothetical protein ACI888_001283, partial [Flavobacteriales bacterium]
EKRQAVGIFKRYKSTVCHSAANLLSVNSEIGGFSKTYFLSVSSLNLVFSFLDSLS